MSEKRIVVPDGMVEAVTRKARQLGIDCYWPILEEVLLWLIENPVVPTAEQMAALKMSAFEWSGDEVVTMEEMIAEWQRRMFLAPEPEVPEEIKDLLRADGSVTYGTQEHNSAVIEAYRRGRNSSKTEDM